MDSSSDTDDVSLEIATVLDEVSAVHCKIGKRKKNRRAVSCSYFLQSGNELTSVTYGNKHANVHGSAIDAAYVDKIAGINVYSKEDNLIGVEEAEKFSGVFPHKQDPDAPWQKSPTVSEIDLSKQSSSSQSSEASSSGIKSILRATKPYVTEDTDKHSDTSRSSPEGKKSDVQVNDSDFGSISLSILDGMVQKDEIITNLPQSSPGSVKVPQSNQKPPQTYPPGSAKIPQNKQTSPQSSPDSVKIPQSKQKPPQTYPPGSAKIPQNKQDSNVKTGDLSGLFTPTVPDVPERILYEQGEFKDIEETAQTITDNIVKEAETVVRSWGISREKLQRTGQPKGLRSIFNTGQFHQKSQFGSDKRMDYRKYSMSDSPYKQQRLREDIRLMENECKMRNVPSSSLNSSDRFFRQDSDTRTLLKRERNITGFSGSQMAEVPKSTMRKIVECICCCARN